MTAGQRETIRQQAGARCEYCRLPESALAPGDFHLEHIVARQHGGNDESDNLARSCMFCNLYKEPNLTSMDPDSGRLTPLFHPRRERWAEHFQFESRQITGLTAQGRTTVWLLRMNSTVLVQLRELLMREGQW